MSKRISVSVLFAYFSGLKQSLKAWQIWGVIYVLNFLFTLVVVAPITKLLQDKIGHSLLPAVWKEGFNYTVVNDFLSNYDVSIVAFTQLALIVGILYFFLSVFTAGGVINVFFQGNSGQRFRDFCLGCTRFFWRMLRITFYFLLIHGLVAGLLGFIFFTLSKGFSPDAVESEWEIINAFKLIAPIYLFFAVLVSAWQDFTKIQAVRRDELLLFGVFKEASSFVAQNFLKVLFFYLLNILTLGLFYLIYRYGSLTFTSMNGVFFFGQVLILGRLGIKLWIAAGGIELTD